MSYVVESVSEYDFMSIYCRYFFLIPANIEGCKLISFWTAKLLLMQSHAILRSYFDLNFNELRPINLNLDSLLLKRMHAMRTGPSKMSISLVLVLGGAGFSNTGSCEILTTHVFGHLCYNFVNYLAPQFVRQLYQLTTELTCFLVLVQSSSKTLLFKMTGHWE